MMEPSLLIRRCQSCGYRFETSIDLCPIDNRALPPADPAAAELGSYRLLDRLGEGGMGAVYRAVHRKLGRVVAIKVLQRDLTADRGIINRFFHEARAANTIRHEHVVEVYDFVEDGENVYFVMEFLKGRDLHEAIHRRPAGSGPIEPARAVAILEQAAAALFVTHAREIIHRDLKPENVFLCRKDGVDDFVKVIDFGIAKLDRPDGRSTVEGAVLGTPEYIAPEQARGAQIDGRADIYSLGCVAFEMLTRHQLFGGGGKVEILKRQLEMEPPPLRRFVPGIPAALDAAVLRALEKDPARRPETALLFAQSLAEAMGRTLLNPGSFQTLRRPTPIRSTTAPSGLVLRATPPVAPPRARAWVWLSRPLTLGAVAAALLIGALAMGLHRRRPPAAATAHAGAAAPAPGVAVGPAPAARAADPGAVTVLLESVPGGAEILDDRGTALGVTPHSLTVPAGSERQVRFQKIGFRPLERHFRAVSDATIAVHLDPELPARAHRRADGRSARAGAGVLDSSAGTIDPFLE
jgi:serine/threonine-protein kinase